MDDARRAELAGLRIGELKKKARAAGVDMIKVEVAIDEADEPKAAIVELILEVAVVAVRAELAQLKLGALRKRAKAVGCATHAFHNRVACTRMYC